MPVKQDWDVLTNNPNSQNNQNNQTVVVTGVPLWIKVLDFVQPSAVVKIEATGSWSVAGRATGPDGDLTFPQSLRVIADYPAGALLGKIGGCTVGQKEGIIFCIGSYCVTTAQVSGTTGGLLAGIGASAPVIGGALFVAVNVDPFLLSTPAATVLIGVSQKQSP